MFLIRCIWLSALFCFFHLENIAQHGNYPLNSSETNLGKITGIITDEKTNDPIEYAAVSLLNATDSLLKGGQISNSSGEFLIDAPKGSYLIKVEFISYAPYYSDVIELNPKSGMRVDVGTISISPSVIAIREMEITGEQSQVNNSLDKKIFNVAKDITNMGGNAQDVMRNIPAVQVDMDGGVSLRGNSNVRILINGKPSSLTGISSSQALERIPAANIESVEVLTNPSVKYDAEGISGIINIVLKKEKKKGLNGLLNVTAGLPHAHSVAFNFNQGYKDLNVFGNISVGYNNRPGKAINRRELFYPDLDSVSYFDQVGPFNRFGYSESARMGMDYKISPKSSIEFSGLISFDQEGQERNTEYLAYSQNRDLTALSKRSSLAEDQDTKYDLNVGYRKDFSKKGHKLSVDAQIGNGTEFRDENSTQQTYTTSNVPDLSSPLLTQKAVSDESQKNKLVQLDHTLPVNDKLTLESGLKATTTDISKQYEVSTFNENLEVWEIVTSVSNDFNYDELITAAYISASGNFGLFEYQGGLRGEQTNIHTELVQGELNADKIYFNMFPGGHVQYSTSEKNKIQLSYSKRIRRPTFWSLNPFWSYTDPLNLWIGNPDLNPEYTHSIELSDIKYYEKGSITGALYYRHILGSMLRVRIMDTAGVTTTRPYNLGTTDEYGIESTFTYSPSESVTWNGSVNFFESDITSSDTTMAQSVKFFNWTGRINGTAKLKHGYFAQAMFNYRAPTTTVQGFRKEMYALDLSLKKTFNQGKGSWGIRISDVFNSRVYRMKTEGPDFNIYTTYQHAARTVYVNLTYKINKYQPERRRGGHDYDMDGMGM